MHDESMSERDKIKVDIFNLLGGGVVRIELSDDQVETALNLALEVYRQKCSVAHEEAFLRLFLHEGQSEYNMPKEVQLIKKIFRRGNGIIGGTNGTLDPFALSYANSYLLSAVQSGGGGLLTYELQQQFNETTGRMFGREIIFQYNHATHRLTLHRDIRGEEEILLWAYISKPDEQLFSDYMARPWLRDWALAECKIMLGRIRGKISAIPGPNGSIQLNGDALVQEGKVEQQYLREQLKRYGTGGAPLGFIFG